VQVVRVSFLPVIKVFLPAMGGNWGKGEKCLYAREKFRKWGAVSLHINTYM
jgi:hypothetical protein